MVGVEGAFYCLIAMIFGLAISAGIFIGWLIWG